MTVSDFPIASRAARFARHGHLAVRGDVTVPEGSGAGVVLANLRHAARHVAPLLDDVAARGYGARADRIDAERKAIAAARALVAIDVRAANRYVESAAQRRQALATAVRDFERGLAGTDCAKVQVLASQATGLDPQELASRVRAAHDAGDAVALIAYGIAGSNHAKSLVAGHVDAALAAEVAAEEDLVDVVASAAFGLESGLDELEHLVEAGAIVSEGVGQVTGKEHLGCAFGTWPPSMSETLPAAEPETIAAPRRSSSIDPERSGAGGTELGPNSGGRAQEAFTDGAA